MAIPLNTNIFIEKANKIHNNKYNYSLTHYTSSKIHIKILCKIHGIFEQIPAKHLYGHGCRKCANENKMNKPINRLTRENFIERANKIHNNKYNYTKYQYKNMQSKSIISCSIHGEFIQKAADHVIDRNGCPKCKYINMGLRNKKPLNQFILEAQAVHGKKYDYSKINYINTNTHIEIICDSHGIFKQTPSKHLMGRGCSICCNYLSNGELKVIECLNEFGYEFTRNKTFPNCKGNSRLLRFDFYIEKLNAIIEYDGEFHSKIEKQFDKKYLTKLELEENFLNIAYYDALKNQYCYKHKMNMLRIPYTKYTKKSIKQIILEFIDEVETDCGDEGFVTKFLV